MHNFEPGGTKDTDNFYFPDQFLLLLWTFSGSLCGLTHFWRQPQVDIRETGAFFSIFFLSSEISACFLEVRIRPVLSHSSVATDSRVQARKTGF